MLVFAVEFGPSEYLWLMLATASLLWGLFGTILVRWSCFALNRIQAMFQSAVAEPHRHTQLRRNSGGDDIIIAELAEKPSASLPIKIPTFLRAFGLVFADALLIGVAIMAIVSFKAAIESDGSTLHPAQIGGLFVAGCLGGLAVLWINRESLCTSWLNAFVISAVYLTVTFLLTTFFFILLQVAANLVG